MRAIPYLCLLAWARGLMAQPDWVSAEMPFETTGIIQLYRDSSNDVLYAAGRVQFPGGLWDHKRLLKYDGTEWQPLGDFNYRLWSAVNYHDTLVVAGDFTTAYGQPVESVSYYAAGSWHPMGSFSNSVRKLKILAGELYAVGSFQFLDGDTANGVARWNGASWIPIDPPPPVTYDPLFNDMTMYNGNLYVGGSCSIDGSYQDITMFDGTSWQSVGGGLQGGISWVNCMEVFNGQLYVGGLFYNGSGNAGNAIMRWDGSTWHAVGTGVQAYTGTYHPNLQIHSMKVHDGKLYVGGGQFFAGNVPSIAISSWDGNQWCNVGEAFFDWNVVSSIEYYHDTLFIATGLTIDGDSVNCIAKWVGGAYSDTCGVPMSIHEEHNDHIAMAAIPIGAGRWVIDGLRDGRHDVLVIDALGRTVRTKSVMVMHGRSEPLDLHGLRPGIYSITTGGSAVRVIVSS